VRNVIAFLGVGVYEGEAKLSVGQYADGGVDVDVGRLLLGRSFQTMLDVVGLDVMHRDFASVRIA
jgi:hypothetical protein